MTRCTAARPAVCDLAAPQSFLQDYIQTLGVNFMEKKVSLRNTQITFSIWDLGGQKEFISMLPLVCNESAVMLFLFDLARPATLASVKEWYRQVRTHNKTAIPFLVGTHFDAFAQQPPDAQVHSRVFVLRSGARLTLHNRQRRSRLRGNMQQQ